MKISERDILELAEKHDLPDDKLLALIRGTELDDMLASEADKVRRRIYGNDVYIRGLIEISNYCKNNCYYCGIRCGNSLVKRYRLDKDEILSACEEGYELGFRTFVLQGGEDPHFTDEVICSIVSEIRHRFPNCAITLSLGEKPRDSYKAYYDAGANRYLLRHETADEAHYAMLHPEGMSLAERKRCLFDLRDIGFQTGSGFMVGSPYQTAENLMSDLRFLMQLKPDMVGIGPFLVHKQTPFADRENGSLTLTLRMISILRLIFPYALIPATTALSTIAPRGRELGLMRGANVVMPNLSPIRVRELYKLYENKICTKEESAQSLELLKRQVDSIGYKVVTDIGNVKRHTE